MLRVCTRRVPLSRCLAVSSTRLNFFGGYKIKSSRDRFEAGGRIGIETMVYEEKHILAELISYYSEHWTWSIIWVIGHLVIKAASNEELRKNADLRMDWVTTLELVQLHVEMFRERLLQLDLDGERMHFLSLRIWLTDWIQCWWIKSQDVSCSTWNSGKKISKQRRRSLFQLKMLFRLFLRVDTFTNATSPTQKVVSFLC